eukprot:10947652-Karenia_brevis.AAC.1
MGTTNDQWWQGDVSTCGQCGRTGFYRAQPRIATSDGHAIYQCVTCYAHHENNGNFPNRSECESIVRGSKCYD